tara:strand:- start:341 stop:1435 length:1095 start_codon:yes stop_codon:yes gene_type:complete
MDNIKVRLLDETESKSTQEVEKELLEKHEQQFNGEQQKAETPAVDESKVQKEEPAFEIKDEDVLSHIKNRYGKEITSLDDFISEREASPEMPEDVEAFFKYKKETGRGIEDFIKLNKDFDDMDSEVLLADYYKQTEEGLDDEDITDLIDSKFGYDEDLDEDSLVKKQKLAKKRELNKAKKFFKEQQESYKVPLESSKGSDDESSNEEYKAYRDKMKEAGSVEAENQKKREWFSKKTDELFSDEFKGFEFNVNDKEFIFKPADAAELKESHQTPLNFIHKYIGDDGLLKDAAGYHKALSAAMNPEKFAKFFYEQGQTDAIDGSARQSKNIDMDTRRAPEATKKGGMQVRSLNQDSGRGLKIRSIK